MQYLPGKRGHVRGGEGGRHGARRALPQMPRGGPLCPKGLCARGGGREIKQLPVTEEGAKACLVPTRAWHCQCLLVGRANGRD